jgi:hypothetical protein
MASSVMAEDEESPNMDNVRKKVQILCNLFPLWIVLTAATALKLPSLYLGIPPSTFPSQIGLLMLCMGISLKPADFKRVLQRPGKSKNEYRGVGNKNFGKKFEANLFIHSQSLCFLHLLVATE